MSSLEKLLEPISIEEYISDYYAKRGLLIKSDDKDFSSLFSFEELNNILNLSTVPHPTLKIVKDAKPIIPTNADDIIKAIRSGASLIIDQIHRFNYNIGLLAKQVSWALNEPTQVNMYLSQPDIKGFDLHYDTHDVFIIQINGFKKWQVYDKTVDYPLFDMKSHGQVPPEKPYIDVLLSPGDVLYIPRGHWHAALATHQASLHLTLGINSRTGIDFINWLKDELTESFLWRQEFPYENFSNGISKERELHFKKLKDDLVEYLQKDDLYKKYYTENLVKESKLFEFNFPYQFTIDPDNWNEKTLFYLAPFQKYKIEIDEINKVFTLYYNKKVMKFKLLGLILIEYILEKKSFSLGEIESFLNIDIVVIKKNLEILVGNDILSIKFNT